MNHKRIFANRCPDAVRPFYLRTGKPVAAFTAVPSHAIEIQNFSGARNLEFETSSHA